MRLAEGVNVPADDVLPSAASGVGLYRPGEIDRAEGNVGSSQLKPVRLAVDIDVIAYDQLALDPVDHGAEGARNVERPAAHKAVVSAAIGESPPNPNTVVR